MSDHRDDHRDKLSDDSDDIKWMSYEELGAAFRIDTASAKRRSFRLRWRRVTGNDGRARVAVPVSELPASSPSTRITRDHHPDKQGDDLYKNAGDTLEHVTAQHSAELARIVAAHTAELMRNEATMKEVITRMEAERDRLRSDLEAERQDRRRDAEAALAERAKLLEAITNANKPWWEKLFRPQGS